MPALVPIWRRSLCAATGAIAGAFTGTVFGLFIEEYAVPVFSAGTLLAIALILAVTAWIGLLILLAAWLHYRFGSIVLPVLVNAVITAILTVFVAYALKAFPFVAPILGAIIGTLVGLILCRYCAPRNVLVRR